MADILGSHAIMIRLDQWRRKPTVWNSCTLFRFWLGILFWIFYLKIIMNLKLGLSWKHGISYFVMGEEGGHALDYAQLKIILVNFPASLA